ncbi:hypothetical protein [Peribacillus muralis]|uniref:hypothetical protein n=1 Tax=Peribacillus muralis TaxID=264697 RepID=UPI00366F4243
MEWYEGLNEGQRLEVLGYTLGFLDATAKGTCLNEADAHVKEYAIKLLDHLKTQIGRSSDDKGWANVHLHCSGFNSWDLDRNDLYVRIFCRCL